MDKPSQSEGTDTKAGIALKGLTVPWRGREKGMGRWEPVQAKKPRTQYKGLEPREYHPN